MCVVESEGLPLQTHARAPKLGGRRSGRLLAVALYNFRLHTLQRAHRLHRVLHSSKYNVEHLLHSILQTARLSVDVLACYALSPSVDEVVESHKRTAENIQ